MELCNFYHFPLFQLNARNILNTYIYHQLLLACFGVCYTIFSETTYIYIYICVCVCVCVCVCMCVCSEVVFLSFLMGEQNSYQIHTHSCVFYSEPLVLYIW